VARHTEDTKIRRYEDYCRGQGFAFRPAVAEIYGGWGDAAMRVFNIIADRVALALDIDKDVALRRFCTSIGVELGRQTALMILERQLFRPRNDDDDLP